MNLVPIDCAAAVPAAAEPSATPGVDFAALMAGLMAGDTQIAPVIDVPLTGEQPVIDEGEDSLADAGSMLGFIGAPPTGVILSNTATPAEAGVEAEGGVAVQEPTGVDVPIATTQAHDDHRAVPEVDPRIAIEVDDPALASELASGTPALDIAAPARVSTDNNTTADTAVKGGSEAQATLASVHPIRSETAAEPAGADDGEASDIISRPTIPLPGIAQEPDTKAAPRLRQEQVATINTSTAPVTSALRAETPKVEGVIEHRVEATPQDGEPQLDVSSWVPSAEQTGRPTSVPAGPVMVGIARRVEQAIAALATRPDPKIVTLQLDELDGVRLTVALRTDGIHLSSTGDASLTADIERALASRGFDLASSDSRGQRRETARDAADDAWKPRPAGNRRRTDQPGITL